jgi:predicted helicase
MPDYDDIRDIRDFESLVEYLRDELDWPFDEDLEIEDLAFDYEPEELGLDKGYEVRVKEGGIKQIRPASGKLPWGIFFVDFEAKRLPVVVLRRALRALVPKKRASAASAHQATWDADDLLFIAATGDAGNRGISFVHFENTEEGLPRLKTIAWDEQETHFFYLGQNISRLSWPDDEDDAEAWRERWASAFTTEHREVIRTSKELSKELARLARRTRDLIRRVYDYEAKDGALHKLHESFKTVLIEDLDEDRFADMVAQTISYGLFSARATGEPVLGLSHLEAMVPNTNPFLKELFREFTSMSGQERHQIDFDELGVSELVDMLKEVNVEAVLQDFGKQSGGGAQDPVIHFYEDFLSEYDKAQKVQRGVFYTPKPVVSYIVRSVDRVLRDELGCPDGLADTSTMEWKGEIWPKVMILDPATGTGTFLETVIEVIYETMTGKWKKEGKRQGEIHAAWNEYVPKHLLPRLHGFELMMAPYSVALMKLGLKLKETGYEFESGERLRVYLTNTLEEPQDFSGRLYADFLAHEAEAANRVKREVPVTVVIGNPPYSKISANLGDDAVRLVGPFRYVDGEKIVEKGALAFELSLQDDYVKFFGFMLKRMSSVPIAVGSYISNFRYLDSPFLRGLRQTMLNTASRLSFLNLGGHVASRADFMGADDNVFDIEQGVAISVLRKREPTAQPQVSYCRLYGKQQQKYQALQNTHTDSLEFTSLSPASPMYKFTDSIGILDKGFEQWASLDEIFPMNSGSIITSRDNLAIAFDDDSLLHNIEAFAYSPENDADIQKQIGFSIKSKWDAEGCKRKLRNEKMPRTYIRSLLYRPFDVRRIYYYVPLLDTPSRPVSEQLRRRDNIVLLTPKIKTTANFNHALVSRYPAEKKVCSHDRATQMFPLWREPSDGQLPVDDEDRVGNIEPEFMQQLRTRLDREGHSQISPYEVLHYIYAILYSPT